MPSPARFSGSTTTGARWAAAPNPGQTNRDAVGHPTLVAAFTRRLWAMLVTDITSDFVDPNLLVVRRLDDRTGARVITPKPGPSGDMRRFGERMRFLRYGGGRASVARWISKSSVPSATWRRLPPGGRYGNSDGLIRQRTMEEAEGCGDRPSPGHQHPHG
jgi:hypothetical protein